MNELQQEDTALLIIDVQRAIDDPIWSWYGERNNINAEKNMAEILKLWRTLGRPIIHVKHESIEPNSTYRPGQAGCDFKDCVMPLADEYIVIKHVNSAFIGTNLKELLKKINVSCLVVFGVITNNSVDISVRMAGNLGYNTFLVEDACFTFPKPDYNGKIRTAEEIHAITLANLDSEYCRVISTQELKSAFLSRSRGA